MESNEGQLPKAKVIYRKTHYDPKKKKWITLEAKNNYIRISLYVYHVCKTRTPYILLMQMFFFLSLKMAGRDPKT